MICTRDLMKTRIMQIVPALLVIFVSIGVDQLTKEYARNEIRDRGVIQLVDDYLIFVYAENEGAFLSFGSDIPEPFKFILLTLLPLGSLVVMAALLFLLPKLSYSDMMGLSLITGGGFSNIIDRLVHDGCVTDFINVGIGPVIRTGVLNIADLAITTGILTLIIRVFNEYRSQSKLKADISRNGSGSGQHVDTIHTADRVNDST